MPVVAFDHVNVLTANLAAMVEWYDRILGLKVRPRPDFAEAGAWLYLGETAIVHLVEVAEDPENSRPKTEHFALRAAGLDDFRAHLTTQGVSWREAEVPGFNILQINIFDPYSNHIHVDFDLKA